MVGAEALAVLCMEARAMEVIVPEVRSRMPLAEAVWLVFRHAADSESLKRIFQVHRGRHYTRLLEFPRFVDLVGDCLLLHRGSGRRGMEIARQRGELPVSIQAAYGKLRRVPIDVSVAFLSECTKRLRELYPASLDLSLPKSLRPLHVLVVDGKTIKWVQRRLQALRSVGGGIIGGKALVALSLREGLALDMHAHPDGDVNEVQFVSTLTQAVRAHVAGPRLWVADRAFGYPQILSFFAANGDAFVVRARKGVAFEADSSRPARTGRDAAERVWREEWGWLGRVDGLRRVEVRRITLERPQEEPLVLLTNLHDPSVFPAAELLDLYRLRWGIERVFQQITEVFGLKKLIGTSPEATVFQLAFCLLLYNIIQLARSYIAAAQDRQIDTISTEKLFDDVTKQLIAWNLFFPRAATVDCLAAYASLTCVKERLREVLDSVWTPVWIKALAQKRRTTSFRSTSRSHTSAFRALGHSARRTESG